ncbi:MAG: 16S rRNA (guanine(966)-N(2))-methyltransferase RsmD [Firmicutes bacterium]|nr:16S rRNA (guanine(966)-N(2))-methyltransferase RsmD [Bacillota bacterium]
MRVISGSARGLKLKAPKGSNTRPTADRIKESLFNIIAGELCDICFLDLFGGSGAIGIEAISRGAAKAVFIDSDREAQSIIKDNIKAARFEDKCRVIGCDIKSGIARLSQSGEKFDIIFMDPPYDRGLTEEALDSIVRTRILKDDGFIICEQAIEENEPDIEGLCVFRTKEYKIAKMTFIRYSEEQK